MKLAPYIACICEGSAEAAIIDVLVDNNLLIFTREDMLEESVIRCRSAKTFEERFLRKGFKDQISVIRILDSRREEFRLSKAYEKKVDVINVITAPEIEMLIIHSEGAYERFKRSGKKPSEFCKADLRMHNVKSYDFVKDYFSNSQTLVRGYVPFDKDWTGFSAEEYREASESVMREKQSNTVEVRNRLDLTGYEVVRAQYFATLQNPAMTISNGRLRFNAACLKKFDDVEYVELLLNSIDRCIAIRPCEKSNPNAIRWGRLKEGRWCASTLGCRGLTKALFDIMEWDEDLKYRFRGQWGNVRGVWRSKGRARQ